MKVQPKESLDDIANRLQREGKAEQLEKVLQEYSPSELHAKERESYFHLWGICAFRRGDHKEALRRFSSGLAECPESQRIMFSLGQEYEWFGEQSKAFELFDQCSFPAVPSNYCIAMSRYAYLWQEMARMERYLSSIMEAYFSLGIADDHFVWMRGLPFFHETFLYFLAAASITGDFANVDALLKRAEKQLTDTNILPLRRLRDAVCQRSWAPLIAFLEREIASSEPNLPLGYKKVQLACARASASTSYDEAVGRLHVPLASNDFPWLGDILLAMRAHLARTFHSEEDGEVLVGEFVTHQPLLFEPSHAVAFFLIEFQEGLKAWYKSNRKKNRGDVAPGDLL
ncbi:MAG: hypothetical protein QY326_09240 [Bdellovibrionota bacterium]|nr:MAG: hypothetical protein QY326_09240 [Bdellovibrionota bacterium]